MFKPCFWPTYFLLQSKEYKLMLSKDILEKGQKGFCLQNSYSFLADVKPIVNKNQFEFI